MISIKDCHEKAQKAQKLTIQVQASAGTYAATTNLTLNASLVPFVPFRGYDFTFFVSIFNSSAASAVISWLQVKSKESSGWYRASSPTSSGVQIQEVAGKQDSPIA